MHRFPGVRSSASTSDLSRARTPGYHLRHLRCRVRNVQSLARGFQPRRTPEEHVRLNSALRQSLYSLFVRGARVAVHRCRVVVLSHHSLPPLGTSALEDTAGMTGRDPAIAAAFRTAVAKGDVLAAIGTDDDEGVRKLELLLPLGVEAVEEQCKVAEGLFE